MRKLQITTLYIPIVKWIVAFILFSLFTVSTIYVTCYFLGPPDLTNEQNTVYYGEEGNKIGEEKGNENRHWISFDEMSPHVIDATLAIEDQRFYEHHGFDFKRIIGAVVRDIKSRSLKEGASTLTQQYARTLYLSSEKTWKRKIKEALYTVRLEMFYSKEELLEGYLNSIYYGHGAYGVEAASELYFNKHAKDLTLAESALLAGIPKGPTYYSPFNDLKRSEKRQQLILREMFQENYITKQQYEIAKNETLVFAEKEQQKQEDSFGSYFKDVVLREAAHVLDLDREAVQLVGLKFIQRWMSPHNNN
ncbi:transglycosylase domain-containing protein [Virgibacillus soli]|uniref:peptidoglycan glycosyltransferase n=1 Tax=Paracerasibacillus soli TaxID=480284 RepID=A0ABU5CT03_9BACI|nr:transglycosylase domain-containing protein [Virgibacillus soli]MDY0409522.1 transglycosylase domain-containing protein [Virgibacillus soli]